MSRESVAGKRVPKWSKWTTLGDHKHKHRCLGSRRAQGFSTTNPAMGEGINQIVRELCDLLDQQMQVVAGRGIQDLTSEELAKYQPRRARIAALRSELAKFVRPV